MDYLGEAIAFGIDMLIFGVCVKKYLKNKKAISMIQGAPYLEIDNELKEIVQTYPEQKLPYVAIRGTINPLGDPIISSKNPNITGVVQFMSIKEHVVQRTTAGAWSEHERVIQEVHNVMPFALKSGKFQVEIVDPLAADVLDMDVISDVFKPSQPSVMDHIWGFFCGVRQRGVQETEKMLRSGAVITGIGELSVAENGKTLRLQPPCDGSPFYLTNMQIFSLVKKLDDSKKNYRLLCILFGSIGLIIGGLIIRRYWKEIKDKKEKQLRKEQIANSRRARRRVIRDEEIPENQLCVVCRMNPREIILLPCGHVCLCEDCGLDINDICPICRAQIEKKSVAYIS